MFFLLTNVRCPFCLALKFHVCSVCSLFFLYISKVSYGCSPWLAFRTYMLYAQVTQARVRRRSVVNTSLEGPHACVSRQIKDSLGKFPFFSTDIWPYYYRYWLQNHYSGIYYPLVCTLHQLLFFLYSCVIPLNCHSRTRGEKIHVQNIAC